MEASPSKPRKIAVVIRGYGVAGGAELFASEVTSRLAQNRNFELHVFADEFEPNSNLINFHKVPIIEFPRFLHQLSFAWFANRMISRMNFDLIHTHEWIFKGDIFTIHSLPHRAWIRDVRKKRFASLFDLGKIAVERRALSACRSSWYLPVSSIAMQAYQREYTELPGHWQVLSPGVDVTRFSAPDRALCRADIRGRYGIDDSDILLIFVGRSFGVKGLDIIIEALANARSASPRSNIRLLVVGFGGSDEGKFRGLAQSLGIGEAVIFAGVQTEGLERYYRAADIFILLSKFDTFGMVVLEAMAAGLPVIVSPNVGAKDLVIEGVNGFILPDVRDADAASDRIVMLLDVERRKIMGAAAQLEAGKHTWEHLADKLEKLYQEALLNNTNGT